MPVESQKQKGMLLGLFSGMLAPFQTSAYGDMVRGGISKAAAHMIADAYGASLGQLMRNHDGVKQKIGKAKEGGESRIKLSIGGMVLTHKAMSIVRACQIVSDMFEESLVSCRTLPELSEGLKSYVAECEKTAEQFKWFESSKELEAYNKQ